MIFFWCNTKVKGCGIPYILIVLEKWENNPRTTCESVYVVTQLCPHSIQLGCEENQWMKYLQRILQHSTTDDTNELLIHLTFKPHKVVTHSSQPRENHYVLVYHVKENYHSFIHKSQVKHRNNTAQRQAARENSNLI